jgi:hypothetical protein
MIRAEAVIFESFGLGQAIAAGKIGSVSLPMLALEPQLQFTRAGAFGLESLTDAVFNLIAFVPHRIDNMRFV